MMRRWIPEGTVLGLIHRLAFRHHTAKPPWAMRAEAVYWLCRRDLVLARLFWRSAKP